MSASSRAQGLNLGAVALDPPRECAEAPGARAEAPGAHAEAPGTRAEAPGVVPGVRVHLSISGPAQRQLLRN